MNPPTDPIAVALIVAAALEAQGIPYRRWRDILDIVQVQSPSLDLDYLRQHAPAPGVVDLLARALQDD